MKTSTRQCRELQIEIDLHYPLCLGRAFHEILCKAFRIIKGRRTMVRPQEKIDMTEKRTTYQDVLDAPDNKVAELINGKLYLMSRPTMPHATASSRLGMIIGNPYDMGTGGPGDWRILFEPELHIIRDVEVLVPDLAGWRRERMPEVADGHRMTLMPDWVCEVLSPSTRKVDLVEKRPIYARAGVNHLWLVDPSDQSLDAFERQGDAWVQIASLQGDDAVCVPPFDAITFNLTSLWE